MVFSHLLQKVITLALALFLWIPIFIGMTEEVRAADEFATSYDVTYDVAENGVTTVTQKINLRNLTTQYYATEFRLTIGSTQISDVKASDEGGPIEVNTSQEGTSTAIQVKFNAQVAGKDKVLPWTLSFKSSDFAQRQGKVWDISVPKVSSTTTLEDYKLSLVVPSSFGAPSQISPTPKSLSTSFGKTFLTFTKDQIQKSGVSATFGQYQIYDFDLSFNLENRNLVPILTNIALPPDTAFQDLIYNRIEPKPLNVTVDNDGNFLAWYKLERNQKFSVKALGSAKLYSVSKVKKPILPDDLRQKYLSAQKYWEKDNPLIKTRISEILDGSEKTTRDKAAKIYQFVVDSLKYDADRISGTSSQAGVERLGAVTALNNPENSVCMEFTDLFITLAREAGIPARELDGFAFTANPKLRPLSLNKDILHAWPEYYDETRGWVMVDPTWQNTTGGVDYFNKFDLNHFVFVVKGISSQTPVPAGSYKYLGEDSKDVKVTLSEAEITGKPQLKVLIEAQDQVTAGLPGKIKVIVENVGNSLQQPTDLNIKADRLNLSGPKNQNLGPIPAFGKGEFDLSFRTKSFFESFDTSIEVDVAGQKYTKEVKVKPFLLFQFPPLALFAIFGSIIGIYLAVLGVFIYKKRHKKASE